MKRPAKNLVAAVALLLLAAILVCSAVVLIRRWQPQPASAKGPDLAVVEHPDVDGMEQIVRKQIQAARSECDSLMAAPGTARWQRGRAWGELGKLYLVYHYTGPAIACFQNAETLAPDDFRWSYLLAHALVREGKIDEAVAAMQRALKVMKADAKVTPQDQLAAMCFIGDMMMRQNRLADARRTFEGVLADHPNCAFVLVKLGQLATEADETDEAVRYFERAREVLPGQPEINRLLAAAYRRQGNVAKAAEFTTTSGEGSNPVRYNDPVLASALKLDRSAKHEIRLGLQHLKEGRNQQGADCFARAVLADPENYAAHGNLGVALLQLGRTEEALQHFEVARRKNPQDEAFRAGQIRAYLRLAGRQQEAVEDALAWRKEKPRNLKAINLLAEAYFATERYQEALEVSKEATGVDPAQPKPYLDQARALAAVSRYADARDQLEKALKMFPDDDNVRAELARFLVTCPDDKQRDAERGLKLSQEMFAACEAANFGETLALALAESGRFDEAVKRQRWAIEANADEVGPDVSQRLQRELKCLEAQQPYREPWPFCTK